MTNEELEEMKKWGEENSYLKSENRKLKEKVEQLNNDVQTMDEEYMALLRAYNQLKENK